MFVLFVAVSLLTWLSYKSKHALKNSILPYQIACFGNTSDLVKSASLAFFVNVNKRCCYAHLNLSISFLSPWKPPVGDTFYVTFYSIKPNGYIIVLDGTRVCAHVRSNVRQMRVSIKDFELERSFPRSENYRAKRCFSVLALVCSI